MPASLALRPRLPVRLPVPLRAPHVSAASAASAPPCPAAVGERSPPRLSRRRALRGSPPEKRSISLGSRKRVPRTTPRSHNAPRRPEGASGFAPSADGDGGDSRKSAPPSNDARMRNALAAASVTALAIGALHAYDTSAAASWQPLAVSADAARHLITGGLGGSIGAAAVYPIDVVKTRLQAQRRTVAGSDQQDMEYNGALDCFTKIVRNEGVSALYAGLPSQLIGVIPDKAVKLSSYDFMMTTLGSTGVAPTFVCSAASGLFAGLCQVIFSNPREIVKIQLQLSQKQAHLKGSSVDSLSDEKSASSLGFGRRFSARAAYVTAAPPLLLPSSLHSTWEVVRELGGKGIYRGSTVCALRDMLFSSIYFPLYASGKDWFICHGFHGVGWVCLAGTLAGIPAILASNPIDVVKTRVHAAIPGSEDASRSPLVHLQEILEEGGWKRLFTGVIPRMIRTAPQFGLTLLVYEKMNDILHW